MALFSNQTIVITGASGGVGHAIALALAERGAMVCLSGRNQERLNAVAAQVPEREPVYPADLTIEEELRSATRKILDENQHVDALIHLRGNYCHRTGRNGTCRRF